MAVRICQASKDELGKYTGGTAGNQTGSELNIRSWYNRPWDTVLRPLDPVLGVQIAGIAQILANCKQIGYDQSQRTTLYDQCAAIGWDISRINSITPCECDCSSLIAVILRFCGVSISKHVYTGNMSAAVLGTDKFVCLRDPKYLSSDQYLQRGDIVLNTMHHVAVALDDGSKAAQTFTPYAARVTVNTHLNVRTGPGVGYRVVKVNSKDFALPNGLTVAIVEEVNGWGRISDINGWVSLAYLTRG